MRAAKLSHARRSCEKASVAVFTEKRQVLALMNPMPPDDLASQMHVKNRIRVR